MAITSIRPAKKIPALKKYLTFFGIAVLIFGILIINQEKIPEILGIAKKAKISILSEEGSKVYIDSKYIGDSPIENIEVKAGLSNIAIKGNRNSYTTSLNLVDKSENILFRDLGINKKLSSGINIWEGTPDDKKIELFIYPENSKVKINDKEVSLEEIFQLESGEYKFNISSEGYKETEFTVNVRKDFKTNIEVKLAPLPNLKNIELLGSYQNIYVIDSNNSDVFFNTKDWVDYFIYFYSKRNLNVNNINIQNNSFFEYFVDYDGRIFDNKGNQIDTLNTIETPYSKKVGLLVRSNEKDIVTDKNFKSLLFFNSNIDINNENKPINETFSAKISALTDEKVEITNQEITNQEITNQEITETTPSNNVLSGVTSSKKFIIINNEWLRVRKEPNGSEIGQVKLGEEFEYLDETSDGWVRIIFKENIIGYVSKQFIKMK